jgi:hypothetical protein
MIKSVKLVNTLLDNKINRCRPKEGCLINVGKSFKMLLLIKIEMLRSAEKGSTEDLTSALKLLSFDASSFTKK